MLHWGTFAFIAAITAAITTPAIAQDEAASGQMAIGTPDLSAAGDQLAEAAAACDNSVPRTTAGGGTIKRYKITFLSAWTEYNTGTCAANGAGSWKVDSQQKCDRTNCGKVTVGTLTQLPLGSGACPGHKYNFRSLCYTWEKHDDAKITDSVAATWTPPTLPQQSYTFPIKVPIVIPDGDTTQGVGWDGNENGEWQQQAFNKKDPSPPFDWSLNTVQETDPGSNPKSETCWCKGSKYPPFYKITGGTWFLDTDGSWRGPPGFDDYDHVGIGYARVRYYRLKRRAPCGTTFPQQMQFQATNVSKKWYDYGPVNTLGGSFDYAKIYSTRAGQTISKRFEPGAAKKQLACTAIKFPAVPLVAANFGTIVTVDDPRPVAAAIEQLERLTHKRITYEDAPIAHKQQMVPMVSGAESNDDTLLVARSATLRLRLPADATDARTIAALEKVVADYNAGRSAAIYAVVPGALTHVVPRQAVNAAGRLVPITPLLDRKITIASKPRSAYELLSEICGLLSAAGGRLVDVGVVPVNALRQKRVDLGAANEPARDVLVKLIAATGMPLSWQLLYDPGTRDYALNMDVVE